MKYLYLFAVSILTGCSAMPFIIEETEEIIEFEYIEHTQCKTALHKKRDLLNDPSTLF